MEITNQEARYLLRLLGEEMMRMDNMTVAAARKRVEACLHCSTATASIEALQSLTHSIAARLHVVAPEGV